MSIVSRARRLARGAAASAVIASSLVACDGNFAHPIATGALDVTIDGLPEGVAAAVTLERENVSHEITQSEILEGLPAGHYVLVVHDVEADDDLFAGETNAIDVEIVAGETAEVDVEYAVVETMGALQLSTEGLPEGASATWRLLHESEEVFSGTLHGNTTQTIEEIPAGEYALEWDAVTWLDGDGYPHTFGALSQRNVSIDAGETSDDGSAVYMLLTGVLDIWLTGPPDGTSVTISLYSWQPGAEGQPTGEPARQFTAFSGGITRLTNIPAGYYLATWPGEIFSGTTRWVPYESAAGVPINGSFQAYDMSVMYQMEIPPE